LAALVSASALLLLVAAVRPAAAGAGRSVSVRTGRGDLDLRLYAPEEPIASSAAPRPDPPPAKPLVLLISGEGGWRRFDAMIVEWLSAAGYWVGGVDAMKYFWEAQDDRQALASDIRAFADALAAAAARPKDAPLVLAGFSFGADLAPWVAGAGGWGSRIAGLLMIGPDETGSLEFRFSEILGFEPKDHVFPVAEALRSAAGVPVVLIHGEKDASSAALALSQGAREPKKLIVVSGADHHFSDHEQDLRRALIEALEWLSRTGGDRPPGAGDKH